jgi:hypothetical protein
LRVFFEATHKPPTGESLNSIMAIGKIHQLLLFTQIIKWRQLRIAVTADITKMHWQIDVARHQRPLMKILWGKPDEELMNLMMTTLAYGTASVGSLAVMCLNKLGGYYPDIEGYELVRNSIRNDFYMDDYLSGEDDSVATKCKIDRVV